MRTTWLIGAAAAAGLMAASLQPAAADDSHRGGTLRLLSQSENNVGLEAGNPRESRAA